MKETKSVSGAASVVQPILELEEALFAQPVMILGSSITQPRFRRADGWTIQLVSVSGFLGIALQCEQHEEDGRLYPKTTRFCVFSTPFSFLEFVPKPIEAKEPSSSLANAASI